MEVTGFVITEKMEFQKPMITGFKLNKSILDTKLDFKALKMPKLKGVV